MGPDKGRNLAQALLSRNMRSWHRFDEIEGIGKDWDDTEARQDEQKQKFMERRGSSVFPWSTPNQSGAAPKKRYVKLIHNTQTNLYTLFSVYFSYSVCLSSLL